MGTTAATSNTPVTPQGWSAGYDATTGFMQVECMLVPNDGVSIASFAFIVCADEAFKDLIASTSGGILDNTGPPGAKWLVACGGLYPNKANAFVFSKIWGETSAGSFCLIDSFALRPEQAPAG